MARIGYRAATEYLFGERGKESTLRSLVCRRKIPHFRISERLVVFDTDQLDEWLRSKQQSPTGQPANDAAPAQATTDASDIEESA